MVIKRKTLSEKVKEYLIDSILINQKYKPGDRIVETKLAKELEVSQAPVREAIRDLALMGLLKSEPYKGTRVKKISSRELQQVYEIRSSLESLAVKSAAQKMTEEDLEHIQSIIDNMVAEAKKGNYQKQTELDSKFHNTLIELSGNNILKKVWNTVGIRYWTFIGITYINFHRHELNLEDQALRHQPICDALCNGDGDKAQSLIKSHFLELRDLLKQNSKKAE